MTTEFDRYASRYEEAHEKSVSAFGEDTTYFAAYKAADARRLSASRFTAPRILDFGTGIGGLIPHLAREFPGSEVTGVDVSGESLAIAQSRHGGSARFLQTDGSKIPLGDETIHVAIVSCVMHHLTPDERITALRELRRVLMRDGLLLIFEHNPWNPLTLRAVRQCEFDANARLVSLPAMLRLLSASGLSTQRWEFRLFCPAKLSRLRYLESSLCRLPLGAQYLVAAVN